MKKSYGKRLRRSVAAVLVCGVLGLSPVFAAPSEGHTGRTGGTDTGNILLVNKTHKLSADYEAKVDLVTVKNYFGKEFQVERETYGHFLSLREELLQSGIQIELESAYRSVDYQKKLAEELRKNEGEDYVKNFVAVPGYSEHHTGLALDVAVVVNGKIVDDVYETEETPYQKMHRKLADHGFILRYPPGKAGVTGYDYESWHIRYVGAETARKIFLQNLTLEEYLAGGEETATMTGPLASADYWTRRNPEGETPLSEAEREKAQSRIRRKSAWVKDLAQYPARVSGDAIREQMRFAMSEFLADEPEGLFENKVPLSKFRYHRVKQNCGMDALAERQTVRYALTVSRAGLRYLPERGAWYEDAADTHYDLLQGLTLNPAEPLAVLAESRDKKFCFVSSRHYVGWVDRGAIVFVDRDKWMEYVSPKDFLVVTADKLTAHIGGAFSLPFEMGARLPLRQPEPEDGMWLVSVPVDVNLTMHEAKVKIPADGNVHKGWLPLSENNVIRQSFRFLGDLYGWGGLEGSVDCASFVADVYRTMGVDLPGDSVEQRIGMPSLVSVAGKTREQRLSAVERLRPGDFLFTEEHVMLYLGRDAGGAPRIIHACSSRWFPREGEKDGPLKYYTRRVLVDGLDWYKTAKEQLVDNLVAVGGVRKRG